MGRGVDGGTVLIGLPSHGVACFPAAEGQRREQE